MTTPKLFSNLPVKKLTDDTDYLGLRDKGDIIKLILTNNKEQFNEIKMFSLYGEWGSGKSSLMKYLESELQDEFNTFFFEAWEYEKDENLAYSLIEFLASKNEDILEETCDEILKFGGRILRGLGKSIKMNIPLFTNGPGIELDPAAFVEEVTKEEELTFYKALKEFKNEFKRLEGRMTSSEKNNNYNIIFIDDLDRCEPEQVLNLLSAIKLFFTYGKKTIFFCGVDKKAVEEAVKTKYGEVIKANEYLEKIFDVSFTMPFHDDLRLLLNNYFNNSTRYNISGTLWTLSEWVEHFLIGLDFTNPRRVKKVFNKFLILRNISGLGLFFGFPNIGSTKRNKKVSVFEVLLVVYLIILHEFYHDSFQSFLNFGKKRLTFVKFNEEEKSNSSSFPLPSYLKLLSEEEKLDIPYKNFSKDDNLLDLDDFFIMLSPSNFHTMVSEGSPLSGKKFLSEENSIEILFYDYIVENIDVFIEDRYMSDSSFGLIKDIITRAL
ncbi:KAP family P-loop NTPase fold protein [Flavobacterium beibuense]|uniref:KAP NTPase domain-containing protein n=1 Tax=Flavobacterium beibuense F44-8 TaxID=1406840 RepID=A0A0A2LKV8_9FLAO|nr:P-loop NTPase fold protein [Flavobacterium beibuense]KGO80544.1 hypothetical protein Q763_11055 [Flavobacterium beibuense F44-8]